MEEFLLVLVGGALGLSGTVYSAIAAARSERRKERIAYLMARMDLLAEAAIEYEAFIAGNPLETEENKIRHAAIIGKAIAACLSVPDFETKDDPNWIAARIKDESTQLAEVEVDVDHRVYEIHRLNFIARWRLTRSMHASDTRYSNLGEITELNLSDRIAVLRDMRAQCLLWGDYKNRNRDALFQAMNRLSVLIAQVDKR